MNRHIARLAATFGGLFLFFISTALFGQMGALEGTIKDQTGNLLVGAVVSIDRVEIKQHFETKTDKKGRYFHAGLPSGTYNVTVKVEGRDVWKSQNIRVVAGDPTRHDIDIKAEQAKAVREMPKEMKEQLEKIEKERKLSAELRQLFDEGRTLMQAAQIARDRPDQVIKVINTAKTPDEALKGLMVKFTINEPTAQAILDMKLQLLTGPEREQVIQQYFNQALEKFKAAAERDPSQHVIFANLGDCYAALKNYDEGIANYKKALELKDDASYHNNLGSLYARVGKVVEAQDEFKKAAEIDPPNAYLYYFNLGAIFTNTGRVKEAAEAFKKAIEVKPDYADAHYQYGISLYADPATMKDAVAALTKYLELEPAGKFAEGAKQLIEAANMPVPTGYTNPESKKKPGTKKP